MASPELMALGGLQGEVDFSEVAEASKPGALLLLAEPTDHVNKATFEAELAAAVNGGF